MTYTIDSSDVLERVAAGQNSLSRSQRQTAEYLQKFPEEFLRAPIRDLARKASVSEPTLIRFCRSFGFEGLSDFRLALAMSLGARRDQLSLGAEPSFHEKSRHRTAEKALIARKALELLETDRSIILDSGSTSTMFADLLTDAHPLSILTTSITSLLKLRNCRQHQIVIPGGTFRPDAMAVGGRMAEEALRDLTFDTAYIGADSVHPEQGLSTFDEAEAHLTSAIVNACRRVVVLADSSKFRVPALRRICHMSKVDVLVTDEGVSTDDEQTLQQQSVAVLKTGSAPAS